MSVPRYVACWPLACGHALVPISHIPGYLIKQLHCFVDPVSAEVEKILTENQRPDHLQDGLTIENMDIRCFSRFSCGTVGVGEPFRQLTESAKG